MLNFQDNFFFAKFTVLFFILTIFGFWGIDLNSEELYIAFSFFLLVILGVILSRRAILTIFVKSINQKYLRLVRDLVSSWDALFESYLIYQRVRMTKRNVFVYMEMACIRFISKGNYFTRRGFGKACMIMRVRSAFFLALLPLSLNVFVKNTARLRKFYSFSGSSAKLFSIKF